MTKEEYNQQMKLAEALYQSNRKQIMKEFAFSNNTVKAGDIIEDHIGSIKVELVQFCKVSSEFPECVYTGTELKKDRTPKAKEPQRQVFQSNLL